MSIIKQIILSLIVVAVLAGGWFGYKRWHDAGQTTAGATPDAAKKGGTAGSKSGVPVVIAPVAIDSTGDDFSAVGTLMASQEVQLFPQVTGIVTKIDFTPGTPVAAGQALIHLDDADQQVALDKARIALDDAKAGLARSQKLIVSNAITTVALSDVKLIEQKAEIDVRSAQLDLDKRTMTAPFAGTIGLTDISVGDLVSTSKAIATLDDMSDMTVVFQTPERFAGKVGVDYDVVATAEAQAGKTFPGKIVAVDSRVDEASRTLKMKASIVNEGGVLKPGMAVIIAFSLPGEPHPSVPSLAIQWDGTGSFVWKLDGDTVHRVGVTILDRTGQSVAVVADLKENDRVVVQGVQNLREGIKVARADDGSGTAAPASAPPAGGAADKPKAKEPS